MNISSLLACLALLGPCMGTVLPSEGSGTCKNHDGSCRQQSNPIHETVGLSMLQKKTVAAKTDSSSDGSIGSEFEAEELMANGPPVNPSNRHHASAKDTSFGDEPVHAGNWLRITKARLDATKRDGEEQEERQEVPGVAALQADESNEAENGNSWAWKTIPNCSFMGPVPAPVTSCAAGGKLYEGACWYLDGSKSSLHDCNTVCGKKNLEYDPMTRYVGGDCGNAYKCSQLGHLFNMPGDAMAGLRHEKGGGRGGIKHVKFDDKSEMGCIIYSRGFKQKFIKDYHGTWWDQYKGQGVSWMPGKNTFVCTPGVPIAQPFRSRMRSRSYRTRMKAGRDWLKRCPKTLNKGTDTPTSAKASANMGPPTRICACKAKAGIGQTCATHGDCDSTFCDGAPASQGASNPFSFLKQTGKCQAPKGIGAACSTHQGCKSSYCNTATRKCDKVSWSMTQGAARGNTIHSPWCLSNGPDGCAVVLSMVGAGITRAEAIAKAKRICASIDECNSIWCCTTGCTNALCYASTATAPNYKQKDCPGLKGSFLESNIPVTLWRINRPASHVVKKKTGANPTSMKFLPTVAYPFKKVKLDWTGIPAKHRKHPHCFRACGNRGGSCAWCGTGACCAAGYISWEIGGEWPGCNDTITRSAGHSGWGCVPSVKVPSKNMQDADTGEAITFLPVERRFTMPPGAADSWLKKGCAEMKARGCKNCCQGIDNDMTGLNFQILLQGYMCGPNTDKWATTYHHYTIYRTTSGWVSAATCLKEGKKAGAKAILWSPGWSVGRKYVEPPYNCAIEKTKDVTCPEGFVKNRNKGKWLYIQILPDGPKPNIDGSLVLRNMTDNISKATVHQVLAASAGVKLSEIDVVDYEKHAGGGMLVQFVGSIPIVKGILKQLDDPTSKLAASTLGSHIAFPQSMPPKKETPAAPPARAPPQKKKGRGGGRRGRKPRGKRTPRQRGRGGKRR